MSRVPESSGRRTPVCRGLVLALLGVACAVPVAALAQRAPVCRLGKVELIVGGADFTPQSACTGAQRGGRSNPASPLQAARIDEETQRGRDAEQRRVLLFELEREERALSMLQRSRASDPQAVNRAHENIAALRRELTRVAASAR
jgi:hypothetical protein